MVEQYLEFLNNLAPWLIPGAKAVFSHKITIGVWSFIKSWWWIPLPYFLWKWFLFFWGWWRTLHIWVPGQKPIVLDIKIPASGVKPIRAMEIVMSELYQAIYRPPDTWEKWIEGQTQLSYSFEVVSIEGEIHFIIRLRGRQMRNAIESVIFSQYPDAEIAEIDDYVKNIPSDIPNNEWDLWGSNYVLARPSPYPIRTYDFFETEKEPTEEKIIDPMSSLLEAMAKIGKGEQLWLQIIAKPISERDFPNMKYWSEIKEIKEELSRRKKITPPSRPIILEVIDFLLTGKMPGVKKEEEKEIVPPEMKLTPGERDILAAVEKKESKLSFKTVIRFIYLGKKDFFFKPHGRIIFSYFASFSSPTGNSLVPKGQPIMTKIKKSWFLPINLFAKRRLYLRKRKLFRFYKWREDPFYPRATEEGTFVLSTEELATIFHFPAKGTTLAPLVPKTDMKKGEAPSSLPWE
ncbi:MAG: hypothetical protein PHH50_02320 [Candidatus Pacebacteria bacterium]|nr:hypothetical protein [Candidatus Paceibacterota bacterium]